MIDFGSLRESKSSFHLDDVDDQIIRLTMALHRVTLALWREEYGRTYAWKFKIERECVLCFFSYVAAES